jgi:hypothetical protein
MTRLRDPPTRTLSSPFSPGVAVLKPYFLASLAPAMADSQPMDRVASMIVAAIALNGTRRYNGQPQHCRHPTSVAWIRLASRVVS